MWLLQSWVILLTTTAISHSHMPAPVRSVVFEHFTRVIKTPVENTIGKSYNGVFKASRAQCAVACLNDPECDLFDFDKLDSICNMLTVVCGDPNKQVINSLYWKKSAGKINYYFIAHVPRLLNKNNQQLKSIITLVFLFLVCCTLKVSSYSKLLL